MPRKWTRRNARKVPVEAAQHNQAAFLRYSAKPLCRDVANSLPLDPTRLACADEIDREFLRQDLWQPGNPTGNSACRAIRVALSARTADPQNTFSLPPLPT